MSVARSLLVILVLLNLLALASGQGWLGTSAMPGEPERLTNQIRPDLILLSPQGAPSVALPPRSSISPATSAATSRVTDARTRPAMGSAEAPGHGPTEERSPIAPRSDPSQASNRSRL